MLSRVSIAAINFYQHYISPHKGYCCAYRVYTGENSCSQYAKTVINEHGLLNAFPLIKEQFERCAFAAQNLEKEREEKKKKSDTEVLGDYACDLGCHTLDCLSIVPIPKSCGKKPHSSSSTDM